MLQKNKILLLVVAILCAFLLKGYFFPSDEDLIKKQLQVLSQNLSKDQGESVVAMAGKLKKSLDLFAPPLQVSVSDGGEFQRQFIIEDTAPIKNYISGQKIKKSWFEVVFEDLQIQVQDSTALSELQAKVKYEHATQGLVYDLYGLKLNWKKIEGQWLVGDLSIEYIEPK